MPPSMNCHAAVPFPRFHVAQPLATHMRLRLPDSVLRHLRVLRLSAGDHITLFDGRGGEFSARLDLLAHNEASAVIGDHAARECESPISISIAQAISSGDRMDYTIQKAVELGAVAIQPLAASRSVVQLTGERAQRRVAHWQSLVISACEQCGRNYVPPVHEIQPLANWLQALDKLGNTRFLLSPRGVGSLRTLSLSTAHQITLLAGPEGGFTDSEEQKALQAGFIEVRLGPRVLRTETAAVAALSSMQTLWGDF